MGLVLVAIFREYAKNIPNMLQISGWHEPRRGLRKRRLLGPTLTTSLGRKNIIKTHRICPLSSRHQPAPSPIGGSGKASGLRRRQQPANELTDGSGSVPPVLHEWRSVHRSADQKHIDSNETRHSYSVDALWTERYNWNVCVFMISADICNYPNIIHQRKRFKNRFHHPLQRKRRGLIWYVLNLIWTKRLCWTRW